MNIGTSLCSVALNHRYKMLYWIQVKWSFRTVLSNSIVYIVSTRRLYIYVYRTQRVLKHAVERDLIAPPRLDDEDDDGVADDDGNKDDGEDDRDT